MGKKKKKKENVPEIVIEKEELLSDLNELEKEFLIKLFWGNFPKSEIKNLSLSPSDFSSTKTGLIYQGILELVNEGLDFTLDNLKEVLNQTKIHHNSALDIIGGADLLDELFKKEFSKVKIDFKTDISQLADKIKRNRLRRELINLSLNFIQKLKQMRTSPLNEAKKILSELTSLMESYDLKEVKKLHNVKTHIQTISTKIKINEDDRRKYVGLDAGFPIFSSYLDGIQNELYLLAGPSSVGKTSFITQLAYQLSLLNDNTHILFYSLDQTVIDITAKLIAIHGRMPVDYAKNPMVKDISLEQRRRDAMKYISELKDRFFIFDQGSGEITLDEIENEITELRSKTEYPVVVFIDHLFLLELLSEKILSPQEFIWIVLKRLKKMAHQQKVAIIFTMNTGPGAELRRPSKRDLLPYTFLLSEPYAVFLFYTDYVFNPLTPFMEWDWGSEDVMVPVSELEIIKNKMKEFTGRLFFKYYNSFSAFKECVELEIENYNAMIQNLQEHVDDKKFK